MRSFLFASLLLFSACASQLRPVFDRGRGLETSIHPVYYAPDGFNDPTASRRERRRFTYRACAAVYVAPNLLATSSSAFPAVGGDSYQINTADIQLADGDKSIDVVDLSYADPSIGLIILRTAAPGNPLRLRESPVTEGERLHYVGYSFRPSRTFVARSAWSGGDASMLLGPYGGNDGRSLYLAKMQAAPGICGSAILDEQGRLTGIAHRNIGGDVSVITATAIADAVRQVSR